jgi:hypothetical protein
MSDLDDLVDVLGKLCDAYKGDDDATDGYYSDEEEDDFSRHQDHIFRTTRMLDSLTAEAEYKSYTDGKLFFEKKRAAMKAKAQRQPPTKRPPTKTEQSQAEILRLRKQTAEVVNEMDLQQKVEEEFERYVAALRRRNREGLRSP